MKRAILTIVKSRFDISAPEKYMIFGFWPKGADISAYFCGLSVPAEISSWEGYSASERFNIAENTLVEPVVATVTLPDKLEDSGRLKVYACTGNKRVKWFSCTASFFKKQGRNPQIYIEHIKRIAPDKIDVCGWAVSDAFVEIEGYSKDGSLLEGEIKYLPRPDVKNDFAECDVIKDSGFHAVFKNVRTPFIELRFKSASGEYVRSFSLGRISTAFSSSVELGKKGFKYLNENGLNEFAKKFKSKMSRRDGPVKYSEWIIYNFASEKNLKEQRRAVFEKKPLISIVVPLYRTNIKFLDALIDSVKAQTYPNWELCLSDGSGKPSPISERLKEYEKNDKRIKVIEADEPLRIVANTNRAIDAASGDYIAFADHDDLLAPDALFEVVKAINEEGSPELIYSDEDKIYEDKHGVKYCEPHMKPDLNIDLLRSVNYICHLCVIKRSLLDKIGLLNEDFEGAQDYDLILRAVENTKAVYHIPKVLYHWRIHAESTSGNPESKKYAFEAGKRAIEAHFDRLGIAAEVSRGEWDGLYRTRYLRDRDPLISIIIPNKDHIDDLKRCIDSIEERSTYRNYEFVIVENNSTEKTTFEYYEGLKKDNPKVKVLYYEGEFNYSKINNFGIERCEGEYLLLLNNDTRIINDDCLEELLSYCMRDDVGAVGARLYYDDDTIQHAGVIVGLGGVAGHCFVNHKRRDSGYCHRIICAQDYSSVTAACMMVPRRVFEEVGGFYEGLAVAFNDVDFCLRIRQKGYLIVYNPFAELYHYESKSRGLEDTPEKLARFNSEIETIRNRWPDILEKGDPYYNPNLTLNSGDLSLKRNW